MADGYDGSWHEPDEDFYSGPDITEEYFAWVSYLRRVADSYPHNKQWQEARVSLALYESQDSGKSLTLPLFEIENVIAPSVAALCRTN